MTTSVAEPFEAFTATMLNERSSASTPPVKAIAHDKLVELARQISARKVRVHETPIMSLTARRPYDSAGLMDVYMPGRWDCSSNLVFMDVIRQTGPSVGEWEGSVAYVRFTAPSTGTYLVIGNCSGYQITINMHGPWGNNTAYCPTTSDHAEAIALWDGTAGESLFFTINFTGPIIGYLESVQVFLLS